MGRVGLTAGAAKDEALRWVGLWLVVSACLPGLAAPRAGCTHEGAPLVGQPPDDQSVAVGVAAEGVGRG